MPELFVNVTKREVLTHYGFSCHAQDNLIHRYTAASQYNAMQAFALLLRVPSADGAPHSFASGSTSDTSQTIIRTYVKDLAVGLDPDNRSLPVFEPWFSGRWVGDKVFIAHYGDNVYDYLDEPTRLRVCRNNPTFKPYMCKYRDQAAAAIDTAHILTATSTPQLPLSQVCYAEGAAEELEDDMRLKVIRLRDALCAFVDITQGVHDGFAAIGRSIDSNEVVLEEIKQVLHSFADNEFIHTPLTKCDMWWLQPDVIHRLMLNAKTWSHTLAIKKWLRKQNLTEWQREMLREYTLSRFARYHDDIVNKYEAYQRRVFPPAAYVSAAVDVYLDDVRNECVEEGSASTERVRRKFKPKRHKAIHRSRKIVIGREIENASDAKHMPPGG